MDCSFEKRFGFANLGEFDFINDRRTVHGRRRNLRRCLFNSQSGMLLCSFITEKCFAGSKRQSDQTWK